MAGAQAPASPRRPLANANADLTPALDESQKRAAVVGALPLDHQSNHQPAVRVSTPPGHEQPRLRGPDARARTKAGLDPPIATHLQVASVRDSRRTSAAIGFVAKRSPPRPPLHRS